MPADQTAVPDISRLYFGKDDAESDISPSGLLSRGFIKTKVYEAASRHRKSLIIGRKGSGKSAVCVVMSDRKHVTTTGASTVLLTPDAISAEAIRFFQVPGITSEQSKTVLWRYLFSVKIAKFLLAELMNRGEGQPNSADALRKFLIANGEVEELRLAERLWQVIERLKGNVSIEAFGVKVGAGVEGIERGLELGSKVDLIENELAKIGSTLDQGSQLTILVDKLEDVWSNDDASDSMVIGLLQAARHCNATFPFAKAIVFLRTDIYEYLQFDDRDKYRGEEMRIDWSQASIADLILRRAQASLEREVSESEFWSQIFPPNIGTERTQDFIIKNTLMRPRDAIQLCNLCLDTAVLAGEHRVTEQAVLDAIPQYSGWKLQDLTNEYGHNYPYLNDLFVLFQNSAYVFSRNDLVRRLEALGPGLQNRYPQFASVFQADGLLDVLYGIGFLGIFRDGAPSYVYQDPYLAELGDEVFCIHPCFREALRSTKAVALAPFETSQRVERFSVQRPARRDIGLVFRGSSEHRRLSEVSYAVEDLLGSVLSSGLPRDVKLSLSDALQQIADQADFLQASDDLEDDARMVGVFLMQVEQYLENLRSWILQSGFPHHEGTERLLDTMKRCALRVESLRHDWREYGSSGYA